MKKIILYILLSILLVFSVSVFFTGKILINLKNLEITNIRKDIKKAVIFPKMANVLSLNLNPTTIFWEEALLILDNALDAKENLVLLIESSYGDQNLNNNYNQKIIENFKEINIKVNKINSKIRYSKTNRITIIAQDLSTALVLLAEELLSENSNYLIMLQNSDELRATGGFMGSYAKYSIENGFIKTFEIEDIYVADGQYHSYKIAPPGLNEYLSSGKGMRLADSNWNPDLPASAQDIIYFFQEIEGKTYDGVIFINLGLIETILFQIGEVYLPDYKISLNSENFSTLAREGRENFFPGSQEKSNFLNASLKVLEIKIIEALKENPKELLKIITDSVKKKNIQIYSQNQTVQKIFEEFELTGEMTNEDNFRYFYLVESNVAINKANKWLERDLEIKIADNKTTVKINYQNHNQKKQSYSNNPFLNEAKHMIYVNYQRFFTNPENEVDHIKINGREIPKKDYQERIITNSKNEKFKEIALVISVAEESQLSCEIVLKEAGESQNKNSIKIQKQAGIDQIPIKINFFGEERSIILNKDQLIYF